MRPETEMEKFTKVEGAANDPLSSAEHNPPVIFLSCFQSLSSQIIDMIDVIL